ncbi:MAG: hypothetical protein ACLRMZ_06565 [Blautia marasmi]
MEENISAGAADNGHPGSRYVRAVLYALSKLFLLYDLEAWEVGTEMFSLFYPLSVVFPLCWNLYYERKNNFLLYVMPRVPVRRYLTAKWTAYALGAFVIIVVPYGLAAVSAVYVKPLWFLFLRVVRAYF